MNLYISILCDGKDTNFLVTGQLQSKDSYIVDTVYILENGSIEYDVSCIYLFLLQEKINKEQLWLCQEKELHL